MAVLKRTLLAGLAASALAGAVASAAPVYSSREEALARAFPPPAEIERKTHFLTDAQRDRASRAARAKVESSLVVTYVGRTGKGVLGTAYFDTHIVTLGGVEVIAFGEPEDYLPRRRWLTLFPGRRLDPDLAVGRGLAHVTGATLTTRSIADAVRRVLAVHAVISEGTSK